MTPVISDSCPIISFARAKRFLILQKVIPKVIIPQAVYDEIVVKGKGRAGSKEIEKQDWAKIVPVKNINRVSTLPGRLGAGEREAIILTQELKGILLMDDLYAREEAKKRGIYLVSSLDIIEEAKTLGLVKKGKKLLDDLVSASFRLKPNLYREFLHRLGEL